MGGMRKHPSETFIQCAAVIVSSRHGICSDFVSSRPTSVWDLVCAEGQGMSTVWQQRKVCKGRVFKQAGVVF